VVLEAFPAAAQLAGSQAQEHSKLVPALRGVAAQAVEEVVHEFVGAAELRVAEDSVVPGHRVPPLGVALG
jgi:hypothetical protein